MKKVMLNPLELDMETIAQLDERQLQQVVGGNRQSLLMATSTGCGDGSSTCGTGGNSTGCGSGGSTCAVNSAEHY
ncbi:class I lanthipeptide [Chitinophaga vietnamensis]|uniref:class I lanthipeptide n=1 Tax=Chitinophaga vietnamensis TaxID=2593957 RepID=UPI0011786CC9|nr:class I lanthipeptide [Chitinophaga vietnamensis]